MGTSLNEHRFALNDRFDKSTYLTKVQRPKAVTDFGKHSQRIPDLINKAGDDRIELGGKSCNFISQGTEDKVLMRNLDVGITKFHLATDRTNPFGCIYRQEADYTPDHYDSVKIAAKAEHLKKQTKPYVNMKKQTKRDFNSLLQKTDFYKNVLQDNARADYIKRLIEEAQ